MTAAVPTATSPTQTSTALISSRAITNTTEDERPSFAPNSRLIVYATRQGGTELLMNTTLDGGVKTRLLASRGDIREPSWGR